MPDLALAHLAHYRPVFAPLSNGQMDSSGLRHTLFLKRRDYADTRPA